VLLGVNHIAELSECHRTIAIPVVPFENRSMQAIEITLIHHGCQIFSVDIKRKEDQMWHFAENTRCGWADYYANHSEFTSEKQISSESDLPLNFCGECKKRRGIDPDS